MQVVNIVESKSFKIKKPTSVGFFILSSASKTRTCNPSVNSRMLYH